MKILVCNNGVVVSKADTNIMTPDDTRLIEVGECTVHLVEDDDTHNEGDIFTLQPSEPVALNIAPGDAATSI